MVYRNIEIGETHQSRGISAVNTEQRNRRFDRRSRGGVSPDAGAGDNCPGKGGGAGGKHAAEARDRGGQNGDGRSDDVRL